MKISRLLKQAALAIASAGTTLIIAACYGAYGDNYLQPLIHGRTSDGEGVAIQGLEVCAQFNGYETCSTSLSDGTYSVEVDDYLYEEARTGGFGLAVRDIDGEVNGRYQDALLHIPGETVTQAGYSSVQQDIVMDVLVDPEGTGEGTGSTL